MFAEVSIPNQFGFCFYSIKPLGIEYDGSLEKEASIVAFAAGWHLFKQMSNTRSSGYAQSHRSVHSTVSISLNPFLRNWGMEVGVELERTDWSAEVIGLDTHHG